jgi:adenylosuccinate synthase
LNGTILNEVPLDLAELAHVKPRYETLPGWNDKTTGHTSMTTLPKKALHYLEYLSNALDVPICLVSTGAKRAETIKVTA